MERRGTASGGGMGRVDQPPWVQGEVSRGKGHQPPWVQGEVSRGKGRQPPWVQGEVFQGRGVHQPPWVHPPCEGGPEGNRQCWRGGSVDRRLVIRRQCSSPGSMVSVRSRSKPCILRTKPMSTCEFWQRWIGANSLIARSRPSMRWRSASFGTRSTLLRISRSANATCSAAPPRKRRHVGGDATPRVA